MIHMLMRKSEEGATLVMVAFTLMLLMGVAALAIDLSAMRSDRSADQRVTDSAAASGALVAIDSDGRAACEAALAYVAINSQEIGSIDDSGCLTAFSPTCAPGAAESHTVTDGRFTITVTYPVPDDHALMTSGILGAPGQGLVASDGSPCERVGVEMSAIHTSFFAQLLGFDQGTTNVHTVATAAVPTGAGVPLNLLVLDRSGCRSIWSHGNGGIIVDAVVNPNGGGPGVPTLDPGIAAADSDGSAGCSGNGVIDVDGTAVLRADGPEGCTTQTGTTVVPPSLVKGLGCGLVMTFAPGPPGCNPPACTGSGSYPNPPPERLAARLTRAPVDHRYNCRTDYHLLDSDLDWATAELTVANEQNIPNCSDTPAPHIHDLIDQVGESGQPVGFNRWSTTHSCNISPAGPAIDVSGNWWIDCSNFQVRRQVTIRGDAVFDGDVSLAASGHLRVLNTLGDPGYAFFRDGELRKAGTASLTFQYTMVYTSKTSWVTMVGGFGDLTWVAPDSGPFDDLALWSDSPIEHRWAGSASLELEGVFFTPLARAVYTGTSGQNQTKAQWIADSLEAGGTGDLVVRPEHGRAVEFPQIPRTILIR